MLRASRLGTHEAVQSDLDDAVFWYRGEAGDAVALRFLDEVEACVARICDGPLKYREVRPKLRRAVVHGFPYLIYFRYEETQAVTILAIVSSQRRPFFWASRLDD